MGIMIPITELTDEQMADYRKNIANDLVNATSNKSRIDSDRLVLRAQDPVGDFGTASFTAGSEWQMTTVGAADTLEDFIASNTVTPGIGYAFYGLSIQTPGVVELSKIQLKKGVTPIDLLFAWDIRSMQENSPAGIFNKAQIYVEDDELNIQHAFSTGGGFTSTTPYYGLTCEQSGENFVQ